VKASIKLPRTALQWSRSGAGVEQEWSRSGAGVEQEWSKQNNNPNDPMITP